MREVSYAEAELIISNAKELMRRTCAEVNAGDRSDHGILRDKYNFIKQINDVVSAYGKRIAGSALEEATRTKVVTERWLYYDAEYERSAQEDWMDEFIAEFEALCIEAKEQAEEEKKRREEEAERRKLEKQATESDYRRLRGNLLKLIGRRKASGLDLTGLIPEIPKKITKGSVRQIERLMERVKSDYRYLSGRGYRGTNR